MTISRMQTIEKSIESFPPLPDTVVKVIEVTNNPESSANDILRVIAQDQSICTAILKIANSSLFGRPQKVQSLENAIVVLGFNEVKSIVLGQAVVSSFSQIAEQHQTAINTFWDHSFTTGLASKIIGEHFHLSGGQYFIAGLLHDIGKLAMLLTFPDEYSPSKWMTCFSDQEQLDLEINQFALGHDMVGSHLLRKWLFPEEMLAALAYHHNPTQASQFSRIAHIVQLADIMAFLCCNPNDEDEDDIIATIKIHLPDIETNWKNINLPWENLAIESWYAWVKIDHAHGSSIMTMLSR
ncbi:HDOD domain-containing protein [Desulfosediminicola flagellatus]|uniref:HDOD domain-containing protein n=1 Tax=Desulfosediminicola flagellatus TaxID=2569541 RepID=UPI0010AB6504|nr:HDOD domain-containing protein [Desulfosediminicola flagellatus]